MITDVSKYVDFLATNQLTEHQFLILWLVHTKDKDNIALYRRKVGDFDISAIDDLIERQWLDDFGLIKNNRREFNIYDFIVTDKFTKVVLADEEDAFEELRKVYPKWFTIGGIKKTAVGGDPDKMAHEYRMRGHKGNKLEHDRIVDITRKYYEGKSEPDMKLENYIKNKHWTLIEEELPGRQFDVFNMK